MSKLSFIGRKPELAKLREFIEEWIEVPVELYERITPTLESEIRTILQTDGWQVSEDIDDGSPQPRWKAGWVVKPFERQVFLFAREASDAGMDAKSQVMKDDKTRCPDVLCSRFVELGYSAVVQGIFVIVTEGTFE